MQVETLSNQDLRIKTDQPVTLREIEETLEISKEKKKHITYLKNGEKVFHLDEVIEPNDRFIIEIDDFYDVNDETPYTFKNIPIVFEDDYVLVANKKPFLLVHPDGNAEDTLTGRVNAYLAEKGWRFAAQPVNRIDFEASGLVLFAKHPLAKNSLDRQFDEEGTAKKQYLAVVDGRVENREIDINNPIARDRHNANKMIVYSKGKPAHTHISRLKLRDDKSLVKADISTGRKHQIRVHLANLGYPIMNDPLYGIVHNNKGLMLQAYRLEFDEPFSKERVICQLDMDTRFKWFDPELAQ